MEEKYVDITTVVNDDGTLTVKLKQYLNPPVAQALDAGMVTGKAIAVGAELDLEFTVAPKPAPQTVASVNPAEKDAT